MYIDSWENGQYKEIWVYAEENEDDERAMCGLINGDWGWQIGRASCRERV